VEPVIPQPKPQEPQKVIKKRRVRREDISQDALLELSLHLQKHRISPQFLTKFFTETSYTVASLQKFLESKQVQPPHTAELLARFLVEAQGDEDYVTFDADKAADRRQLIKAFLVLIP
jgi:hypothetical protein